MTTSSTQQLPPDILDLEKEIFDIKVFTHNNISVLVKKIYDLEKKYFNNPKEYSTLTHLTNYMQHQINLREAFKSQLLTLIATIFLPVGAITGFFGMNFRSMGAPSLKGGVFVNVSHMWVIIGSIILTILITAFFYINFYV